MLAEQSSRLIQASVSLLAWNYFSRADWQCWQELLSVVLSCVITPNSAPSPALRRPFSLALATKRMNRGTL
jgi:hypothetical protein